MTQLPSKTRSVLVAVVLVTFLVFVAIPFAISQLTVAKARAFLDDLQQLRPGISAASDVARLNQKYVRFALTPPEGDNATFSFAFTNWSLSSIWLAEPVVMLGVIRTDGNRVTKIEVSMQSRAPILASMEETVGSVDKPPFETFGKATPTQRLQLVVRLTTACTEDQRRRAYGFQLTCLSKLGGCNRPTEMLPDVLAY